MKKRIEVIAHRGFSGIAPENTLLAIQKAIEIKVDMIELDVQMTADQQLVVFHDETIDRMTDGKGWVKDFSLARLKEFEICDPKNNIVGERIPTLAEVLTLIEAHQHIKLNIELKTDRVHYDGIERLVLREVNRFVMVDRVIYSSFNHQSLRRMKQMNPKASIAALFDVHDLPMKPWEYILQMEADAIHPHYSTVERDWLEVCQQHRILVRPYTVNSVYTMEQFIQFEVSGMFTDYPDQLQQLLQRDEYRSEASL